MYAYIIYMYLYILERKGENHLAKSLIWILLFSYRWSPVTTSSQRRSSTFLSCAIFHEGPQRLLWFAVLVGFLQLGLIGFRKAGEVGS